MAKIVKYVQTVDDGAEGTTHTALLPDSYATTDQLLCLVVKDNGAGDMTLDAASVTAGWQIAQPDEGRRSSRMIIVSAPGTVLTPPIVNSTDVDAWGSFTFVIRHGSDITSANIASVNPVGFLNENSTNNPYHRFSGITTTGINSIIFWAGTCNDESLSPQPGWGTIVGPIGITNAKTMIAYESSGSTGDVRPSPYWHSGDSTTWGNFDMDQCVFEIVDINQTSPVVVPLTSGGPRGDFKKVLELFAYTQSAYALDPWSDQPTRITDPTNGDHLPTPTTIDGHAVDYIESGTPEFAGLGVNRRRVTNLLGYYPEQSGYSFETPAVSGSIGVQQIDFAFPLGSTDRVTPNTPYSVDFSASLNKMIAFHCIPSTAAQRSYLGSVDVGGMYFYVVDSVGNWRAWMFDALGDLRETVSWDRSYVVDPNDTRNMVDESATAPNTAAIVSCGIGVNATTGKIMHYLSRFYVVEPWVVAGGDATTPAKIADLFDYQKGCFCKVFAQQGTNILYQGIIQIGDGVTATHNVETETTFECQELHNTAIPDLGYNVDESVSGISFNLTASCTVDWKDVIVTAKNLAKLEFIYDTGSASFNNCIFRRCDLVEIRDGHIYDSCTFDLCNTIYSFNPNVLGCIFKNSNQLLGALYVQSSLSTALDGLTGTEFIDNGTALGIYSAGTYTLDNVLFSGNTSDILNMSTGLVTIYLINGSNPVTVINGAGGTTVLVPEPLTLKFVVIDEAGAPVAGAYVYIDEDDILPHIMNTTTDANGEASILYSDGPLPDTIWRARKYGYKPYRASVDIGTENITLPVTLINAPQQT